MKRIYFVQKTKGECKHYTLHKVVCRFMMNNVIVF